MDSIPLYSEDLIKALDAHYPVLKPAPVNPDDLAKFNFRQGQRALVDLLKMRLNQQKEEALDV